MNHETINSKAYWENRFATDWDSACGAQQSKFFAQLAVENLPPWFTRLARSDGLTICDWGCAEGDGTDVLGTNFGRDKICGVDFAEIAIEVATRRYPDLKFVVQDWTAGEASARTFDVVFSSNTLEHFDCPYETLARLAERANQFVVLLLPYREFDRCPEHHHTFEAKNIPITLSPDFLLVHAKVIDARSIQPNYWPGQQIILVYGRRTAIATTGLRLADINVANGDHEEMLAEREGKIAGLSQAVSERDGQLVNLNMLLSEREARIISLSQAVSERDGQLVNLNMLLSERESRITSLHQAMTERDEQLACLTHERNELLDSTSWRITRPLRFAKRFIQRPKQTSYDFAKLVFWRMPPAVRQRLYGPRHSFVRWVKGFPIGRSQPLLRVTDLSWKEFQEVVLSKRHQFGGIFVQELVIDWNTPLYQRPQHVAAALGRLGYLVIYRTANWSGDDVNGFREVAPNVWITNRSEVAQIPGVIRSFYSTTYAHTPESLEESGRRGVLVYEYIDHIDPAISGEDENIRRLRTLQDYAFSGGADFVIASARKLYDEAVAAVGRNKVILVPNGVDTRHYRNPLHSHASVAEELQRFRRNFCCLVGYFGAIAPWLWYEAITEIVNNRPDLGFVFIGPDYYGAVAKLPVARNVLHLEAVGYAKLPGYARLFDVCFIPFKPGDIARTTSPLKLFEYFALEKPVVVTSDMLECIAFPEVLRGRSAAELEAAIDAAFAMKDDPELKRRLAELADENDWNQRAHAYEVVFGNRHTLPSVQAMIRLCHHKDGNGKRYYEEAYMGQEERYWMPVPKWIDEIERVDSVIDVGAAYGTLLTYTALNKRPAQIHAVDPVGYMSESLRQEIGIKLHRLDFERQPIDLEERFDLVIFTEVIEHLKFHPKPTLLKIKELVNPGGRLVLTTPDASEWGRVTQFYSSLEEIPDFSGQDQEWIDGHIWQYSREELEALLSETGFVIERFDYSPGVSARHLCYLLAIEGNRNQ